METSHNNVLTPAFVIRLLFFKYKCHLANTLFIGKVYHRLGELTSTNDFAAALLAASNGVQGTAKSRPPEGTVVRADSQSAGRGQFGSRWESAAGENLTLSIILYPNWLEIKAQFYLSMTIALALLDTVGYYLDPATTALSATKWPNDLYLGDGKAGGILIQNALSGAHWGSAIVGIGLNVNQLVFSPAIARPMSLALAAGRPFELDDVAETLFSSVERRYLQLKAGNKAGLHQEYEGRLYRRGLLTNFQRRDGAVFSGTIQGVATDGRLRIETARGSALFDLKEVTMLFP